MKKLLTIVCLLVSSSVYSQNLPIDSIRWISDDLGGLSFYKGYVHFVLDGHDRHKRYYLLKDTLVMVDNYTTSADNYTKRHIDLFKFRTISADNKTLTLIPVNDNGRKLSGNVPRSFTNINYVKEAQIRFSRIHLNTGRCYGTCPELSIDIDNKGAYYLKGGDYADPYKGYFKGKLTAKQMDTLDYLIQHSQIEKMQGWKQKDFVNDAPPYNLTVYYNDKKLRLETNEAPMNITDLIRFLISTYKKVALIPDPDKHEFNDGVDMKYH